ALAPADNSVPVRVGVGIIGTIIVFALIMGARVVNRRPGMGSRASMWVKGTSTATSWRNWPAAS
ncbi:MAG: hypothetical protein B7Z15_15435, partial [Rhizobiales bacterium 32-66-8]